MRVKNALQSPIEIKVDSIVFDNLVVGPWHWRKLREKVWRKVRKWTPTS